MLQPSSKILTSSGQRSKYLDWNGHEFQNVVVKVLASSEANAIDPIFDGELLLGDTDTAERRRLQNRIAQRNYRRKLRGRLSALEEKVHANTQSDLESESKDAAKGQDQHIDPEVLVYQNENESVEISCICESTSDQRFVIACLKCGTWQHIACYYMSAKDYMDEHQCVQCTPRVLQPQVPSSKRPANVAFSVYSSSTGYKSKRQARTTGAESSVGLHERDGSVTAGTDFTDFKDPYQQPLNPGVKEHLNLKSSEILSLDPRDSVNQEPAPSIVTPPNMNFNFDFEPFEIRLDQTGGDLTEHPHAEEHDLLRRHRGDTYTALPSIEASAKLDARETERVQTIRNKAGGHSGRLIVACPLSAVKHELGLPETCSDLQAGNMAQIRIHLNRRHHMSVKFCNVCLQTVLDPEVYSKSHGTRCTDQRHKEARDIDGVRQEWKELYMSLRKRMESSAMEVAIESERASEVRSAFAADVQAANALEVHQGQLFRDQDDCETSDDLVAEIGCVCICGTEGPPEYEARHVLAEMREKLPSAWKVVRNQLPESYKWDIEYVNSYFDGGNEIGCWTCAPLLDGEPKHIPLTIAQAPVVLPVEHRWPPVGGVIPPPDPRPSLINPRIELPTDVMQDLFLTFEGALGFYVLISGLLQVIVPDTFEIAWASSHLPRSFGGLKVCYITNNMEPTALRSNVAVAQSTAAMLQTPAGQLTHSSRQARATQSLQINNIIEARPVSSLLRDKLLRDKPLRDKYSGRIGLQVEHIQNGQPYLIMSTHVITETILSKSFGLSRDPIRRLRDDWNKHAEIWAGNMKVSATAEGSDRSVGFL
jgi:hypothetical protein